MKKYNFDKLINRENTNCKKWDYKITANPKATNDSLPLWIADMDFECAPPIIDALHKRIDHKIFGYSSCDNEEYKGAVQNWFKRRLNFEIEKNNIFFSPGVVPAIATLVKILAKEDEKIIIQQPVYPPFEGKVVNNNIVLLNNELKYDGYKYEMDFEDLKIKAKDPKVKVMLLCSPHNPVGRVWSKEELKQVIDICIENDLWIISDEIHCDLIKRGHTHIPTQVVGKDYKEKIITMTAPSKSFNLAGLQVSNIIINDKEVQEKWTHEMKNKLDIGSPSPLAITATIAAYNECEDWLDELNEYIDDNMEYIDNYLKENLPKVKLVKREGTYLAWLDFTKFNLDGEELEDKLFNDCKVMLNQGYTFGKEGNGFIRINTATQKEILKECMNRIKKGFEQM
ncbi:MAG: MalY/PatB family protein [Peptostreptococcaceae bacterium]